VHFLLPFLSRVLSPVVLALSAAYPSADARAANPELAEAARDATAALAERQQAPGYWLTDFTGEARFEKPSREMNTFTNAILVDLLDPLAKDGGVDGLLRRTRAFLANQIEADGLVRYHGRPDAPAIIGKLGCVITPDADDTALVWRIAPDANRELRSKALAKLGEFLAGNGLYKTWLAPRDRYRCIDPGRDPNPTDLAIQMHVLLWLAQVDRPAARALCDALSRESSNDDVWVYYGRMAPLIPLLRLPDLHKAGCPLRLPEARLETAVPEQKVWLEVARLQGRMERGEAAPAEHSRAADLLHQLSSGGFARVRSTPPLLYHNDFSASVRRFYWSEDVGYALWLRLYHESERARRGPRRAAPA
jgi:hypothetical protein